MASEQKTPQIIQPISSPDSEQPEDAIDAVKDLDGFNWGYDPYHYGAPEGSYSTDPNGITRIREFREMVESLHAIELRVVMDVVYNHTSAAGQDPTSVLDKVVPGYYYRLDGNGNIYTNTCCSDTASEHRMFFKLMLDTLKVWAKEYHVDGFRFDSLCPPASANTPVLCLVLLLLASQTDGGLRLIRTGSAVTLPVSRLARRSIFILAGVLADPATAEPFTPEASCSAVTSSSRPGYFRLEQQLPGGLSSSHWKSAFFPRRVRNLGSETKALDARHD